MTDLIRTIDEVLQEANECEILGGLAATHKQRVGYRELAERFRILASEARRAKALLDALGNRFGEPTGVADHFSGHGTTTKQRRLER
jgi:hypothetical protein